MGGYPCSVELSRWRSSTAASKMYGLNSSRTDFVYCKGGVCFEAFYGVRGRADKQLDLPARLGHMVMGPCNFCFLGFFLKEIRC